MGGGTGLKRFMAIMALLYFAALLFITLIYGHRMEGYFKADNVNVVPLSGKWYYIDNFFTSPVNDKIFITKEIVGNLLLFFPFAWAVFSITGKKQNSKTLFAQIFLTVISIESLQYLFNIGMFDIDDIILNTTGGLAGIFLFKALHKRYCR